jgi:hypothetical protein
LSLVIIAAMPSGAALAQVKAAAPPAAPMPAMPTPPVVPAPAIPAPSVAPSAPPVQLVPPPPIRDTRVPDAGGPDACDCYATEDVPIMSNGRVIRYERRSRWIGKSVQCCPSR